MLNEATPWAHDSISISEISRDLGLSVKTVLQYASEGMTKLFYPTYPKDYSCLSIHMDPVAAKRNVDSKDSAYTPANNTFNLHSERINGLLLSRKDCLALFLEGKLHQSLFEAAIRQDARHLGVIPPMTGVWMDGECVFTNPAHWRIACYDDNSPPRMNKKGKRIAPSLKAFDIRPWELHAPKFYANEFKQVLNTPRRFLGDLIDGRNIRDDGGNYERPFSRKLIYLIEASEKFWSRADPKNADDHAAKRKKVREYLNKKEFASYFLHDEASAGVLAAAEEFIEPVFARADAREKDKSSTPDMIESDQEVKETDDGYLSPKLITLLAAHKYFWRNPDVVAREVPPPKREVIEPYLRGHGISGNAADYAMTLIRPEDAAYGPPTSTAPVEQASLRTFKNKNPSKHE